MDKLRMNTPEITATELKTFPTRDEWMKEYDRRLRQLMLRLYDDGNGLSVVKIAGIYGCTRQRVYQILKDDNGSES